MTSSPYACASKPYMVSGARFDFECLTLQTGKVTLELVISQMRQNSKGRRVGT
jgi:hypothetical protein